MTLDESVSYALLTVLEQLTPAERTAFVLHDVFDVPFLEVAEIVGRSPDSVRQLASRARRHVVVSGRGGRSRRRAPPARGGVHARDARRATSSGCWRCSIPT